MIASPCRGTCSGRRNHSAAPWNSKSNPGTGEAIGGFLGSTWLGGAIKAPPRVKDAASFSAGIGDGIVDPLAELGGVQTFGLGFGRFARLAFGINNVDENSPDYGGGKVIGTLLTFATGGAEGVLLSVARRAPAVAKAATSTATVRQGSGTLPGVQPYVQHTAYGDGPALLLRDLAD